MSGLVSFEQMAEPFARMQWLLAVGLRLVGWLSVTCLSSLGVLMAGFFTIGSFTIAGTMLQLENLTSRYVAADPARQAQFNLILIITFALSLLLIGLMRRSALTRIFDEDQDHV